MASPKLGLGRGPASDLGSAQAPAASLVRGFNPLSCCVVCSQLSPGEQCVLAWGLAAACVQLATTGPTRCRTSRKPPWPTWRPGDPQNLLLYPAQEHLLNPAFPSYPLTWECLPLGSRNTKAGTAQQCHLQCHPHGHGWHLLGAGASLPCPFLRACLLPRSHMALLLCKAGLEAAPGPGLALDPSFDSYPMGEGQQG